MPERRYFSDANEIRKPDGGLVRNAVPDPIRAAVWNWLDGNMSVAGRSRLWRETVRELDLNGKTYDNDYYDSDELQGFVARCSWFELLDLCTVIPHFAASQAAAQLADDFRNTLNRRLLRHYSAYQMDEAFQVVEPGGAVAEEAIQEARALLASSDFVGPDRQFRSAIESLSRRPDPDYEAAVSQAINAVEGVARILLRDETITLGRALKLIGDEKRLHGALVASLNGLHGYASDAAGRHGLVGEADADQSIATFCLHQAAAAIVLIAALYGRGRDVVR